MRRINLEARPRLPPGRKTVYRGLVRIYCPCPRCERAGVLEDGSPCPVCDGYGGFWLITGPGLQVRAIPGNADEVPDELER